MKKLILMAAYGLLALGVMANDISVTLVDTVVVADTIAGAIDSTTVYTPAYDTRDFEHLNFYTRVTSPPALDGYTAMDNTADTVYFYVQFSPNKIHWSTAVVIDTTLADDSGWSTIAYAFADLDDGRWIRAKVVHRDQVEADIPDSLNNLRALKCDLWVIGR